MNDTRLQIALWGVLPYLCLAVLVAETVWRYRYDRFGFTTRSSQLHESRLLRLGAPLFHYALFLVIGGHVTGLLVPESLTRRLRVSEAQYHAVALTMGRSAGLAAALGLGLLVYRLHALLALVLPALWPFNQRVHAFAAPPGYAVRPYVVYRSRGGAGPARR